MNSAFYPTSDFWFWVGGTPPWSHESEADPGERSEFMRKVVWSQQQPFADIGVCADGLVFITFAHLDENDLASELHGLNTLNLLLVSALRTRQRFDAGVEWISRTSRLRGYDPEKGLCGSGMPHSRNSQTLMARYGWSPRRSVALIRHHVELETLELWSQLASLAFDDPIRVRLLSEYALALSLFHDHNFAGALTHAWFVCEHIFAAQWSRLFPNRNPRTPAGAKLKELEPHMNDTLHQDLVAVKTIRNDLAHSVGNADAVSLDDANKTFAVADRLIQEWGLALRLGERGLSF